MHWQNPAACRRYRTGVSLHSHTLHSRESLGFLTAICEGIPVISAKVRGYREQYFARHGRQLDLARAWWTPVLCSQQAWSTEKTQIEEKLELEALVSLSDHDSIEAGTRLSMSEPGNAIPTSVEWTVPFRQTFFHIGVHNLPRYEAPQWMERMRALTARPTDKATGELLEALHADPATLIIFNHPMWDEKSIGSALHWKLFQEFWGKHRHFIHAMELNGLRPWHENQAVVKLAERCARPLISGGDRHAREPNACLNLTNAATFAEFVEEVRKDGRSDVIFMPQYRENFKFRIIQNMCEVLRNDESHSLGWERWSDRIFYLCDDGYERSLNDLWGRKAPGVVNYFVGLMSLVQEGWLRSALRVALPRKEEPAL